jgi:hypothetical protein
MSGVMKAIISFTKASLPTGTLTFVGPARFQFELDDAGKIRTDTDGTISVTWWLRDERGESQPWMNNTYTMVEE